MVLKIEVNTGQRCHIRWGKSGGAVLAVAATLKFSALVATEAVYVRWAIQQREIGFYCINKTYGIIQPRNGYSVDNCCCLPLHGSDGLMLVFEPGHVLRRKICVKTLVFVAYYNF